MKLGSLFSGGGLGDFGFMAAGMDIAWQCEIDPYCQKILSLRYPESKKYTDIKTLKGGDIERVDIITGGFPCQPFSVAGHKMGERDDRHLWPEMLRIIKEVRPYWVVGENVTGIINMGIENLFFDLENIGYETTAFVFPAHACGAQHKRDRIWIVANSSSCRLQIWSNRIKDLRQSPPRTLADYCFKGTLQQDGKIWPSSSRVRRVANGITDRVHRLKMLGNGQVPACTYVIGKMIMDIEEKSHNLVDLSH